MGPTVEHKVQGNWPAVKNEIRSIWNEITDFELEESKGNLHRIADKIHEKYGESMESIEAKMEKFMRHYRPQ